MTFTQRADILAKPILFGNEDALARAMSKEGPLGIKAHLPPSLPRHEAENEIIALLAKHGPMTARAVTEHLSTSANDVYWVLRWMADEGRIVRTPIGKGEVWVYYYGVRGIPDGTT